jgi:S-methyl-5-thioribose-1-phosphate isomerase
MAWYFILFKQLFNAGAVRQISDIRPVKWDDGSIAWINQTKLPWNEEWKRSKSIPELAKAIKDLEIRGAPAIGIAAAYGIAISAANTAGGTEAIMKSVEKDAKTLGETRPTAVNLFWAIDRMLKKARSLAKAGAKHDMIAYELAKEAQRIQEEDIESNKMMGRLGNKLIEDGDVIMTHCNAGALATGGFGTSYGVIRTAWQEGKDIEVIATHTAPLYQGARLTVWELMRDGIPATLITDNMAAYAMKNAGVTKVLLGADRILMNGDVANKIGTYGLAILAKHHHIPFYVAAPVSTIDQVGKKIKIEQRKPDEVRNILGRLIITVPEVPVLNPAFDVTSHKLVSGIITEHGIARAPYSSSLKRIASGK